MTNVFLDTLDSATSVLFLGSGFTAGAKNIRDKEVPVGNGLKEIFAASLGVNPDDYDLQTLADEVASDSQTRLYEILYETFTVRELADDQRSILSVPWLRVYTTNYDDAVELAYVETKRKLASFSYDDDKPNKLLPSSVVHLHGVIRKTTRENVREQLVLNEASYVRQHFERSPWYDEFARDLRFCSACYFVGYSLRDYHISALLLQDTSLREKTLFINRNPDRVFVNRVTPYGQVADVDRNGFANLCVRSAGPRKRLDPYSLKAFRYIDPFKDKQTLSPPTSLEVLNLVAYGTFNEKRCFFSLPGNTYVIPRVAPVDAAVQHFATNRSLLIYSHLGNGKSVFLSMLAHRLSALGYTCFWCNAISPTLIQDTGALASVSKPMIIFDSYNVAIDSLEAISPQLPNGKFVIAVRTGVQEMRFHELHARIPTPFARVGLDVLTENDRENFIELLDQAGILGKGFQSHIRECKHLRDVVTSIYQHTEIREKLQHELHPLLQDRAIRDIMIVIHIMKWAGQEANAGFVRVVTGKDAYAEAHRFKESASEVFNFFNGELTTHSALFSEYLIDSVFSAEDIVDVAFRILVSAVQRKRQRLYQGIVSSLMQVSNLKRLLRSHRDPQLLLVGLFDRLHRDVDVNREPLFWLQYSLLMLDIGDLLSAEKFLETAYARADTSPGFRPFQIDTHALRVYLVIEEKAINSESVTRFDAIMEKLDLVIKMLGDESHRPFAVRAIEGIEPFVTARLSALSLTEKNALLLQLDRLLSTLTPVSAYVDEPGTSNQPLGSIHRAKRTILAEGADTSRQTNDQRSSNPPTSA